MANRLVHAQSLYLRKHGHNPIDWWPWGSAAIAQARKDNKPIFLSIGYSSCHWCTVMEGEAFSDQAVADTMNQYFLPIKVDREERPDIDHIYIQAVQLLIGQAGWPLNVFLDPQDLAPFYGGTYFPLTPRYGRPGFLELLRAVRQRYDQGKDQVEMVKSQILEYLQSPGKGQSLSTLDKNMLDNGYRKATSILSYQGPGNCFPMIPYAQAVLQSSRLGAPLNTEHPAVQRGINLVLGGIFDHVAGGWHRYTVDPTWTVPHFEKMLYDNGLILEYISNLWSAGVQDDSLRRAVEKTVAWLGREMRSEAGYFYAAQDADNFVHAEDREPEEGRFYVWSDQELRQLLNDAELKGLEAAFDMETNGNFEGLTVLQRLQGGRLANGVESALDKLFTHRYGSPSELCLKFPPAVDAQQAKTMNWPGRIPPVTDTKMIVAWNSLMISGLARAAMVFQEPNYGKLATQCAEFILKSQWVNGQLYRLNYDGQVAVIAQAEDYALWIKALLDLHQMAVSLPGEVNPELWLIKAQEFQAVFDEHYWSITSQGYYATAAAASGDLLVRERPCEDNAIPSANGVALTNLVRLALLAGDLTYLERAERGLQAFGQIVQEAPQSCPGLITALDWWFHPIQVKTRPEILAQIAGQFFPTTVLQPATDIPAVALVCQGLTCQEPATSLETALEQLARYQS
ncbi:thioredoxin domain-containing protein [Gloeomargarita lithophora Alchichica-D10]|uniref:Thioredoxin domain-containing protein n=1 Tax=Gloeomargarita lithophora Alchichica-D10 TaxID=1188229 RepID=A0A1J0AF23_9CYAN|nr:thioredoxin domain-containing protein [Gloeomargarita lithophora]APB34532.1 thioredoxin domain-containing protein [Gloeomargarita lithophora Alchichica-D10]